MKAKVIGRVLSIKDSKDRDGNPDKTAIILQDGETYPEKIMNVKAIVNQLKVGETYEFPVTVIPYFNKFREKSALLAIYDAEV